MSGVLLTLHATRRIALARGGVLTSKWKTGSRCGEISDFLSIIPVHQPSTITTRKRHRMAHDLADSPTGSWQKKVSHQPQVLLTERGLPKLGGSTPPNTGREV